MHDAPGATSDTSAARLFEDGSAQSWQRLLEAIGPASLLVCIRARMSAALLAHTSVEDVWQETLLHVWRDRDKLEWRGLRAFRHWVLGIASNRIRNVEDARRSKKRGGPGVGVQGAGIARMRLDDVPSQILDSTTPSRIAMLREEASAMRDALEDLPPELRDVVRLRLFEELPVDEVAARLALGASAVKHRFRKGAALYASRLERRLRDTQLPSSEAGEPRAS